MMYVYSLLPPPPFPSPPLAISRLLQVLVLVLLKVSSWSKRVVPALLLGGALSFW